MAASWADDTVLPGAGGLMRAPFFSCRSCGHFEKLEKLGEGTYGTVYKARNKETGEIVALKKLKAMQANGFPVNFLREINVLKRFRHQNLVELKEVVVGDDYLQVYLVFEYCDSDLGRLLGDGGRAAWGGAEIKAAMVQILRAVGYLHRNYVIHRDLKPSNLLADRDGVIKVADFGLARRFGHPLGEYSPKVATLWYRPPELLLGTQFYHTALDMWAVGCIFGELLLREPVFAGNSELDQLKRICDGLGDFRKRGTPVHEWARWESTAAELVPPAVPSLRRRVEAAGLTANAINLLERLLDYDPARRITAEEAVVHPYFSELPLPKRLRVGRAPTPVTTASAPTHARRRSWNSARPGPELDLAPEALAALFDSSAQAAKHHDSHQEQLQPPPPPPPPTTTATTTRQEDSQQPRPGVVPGPDPTVRERVSRSDGADTTSNSSSGDDRGRPGDEDDDEEKGGDHEEEEEEEDDDDDADENDDCVDRRGLKRRRDDDPN